MTVTNPTPVDLTTRPAAGLYEVDPAHTRVTFVARHLVVAKVRGQLPVTSGRVTIGEDLAVSGVTATIDTAGVGTGDANRDAHLRSADFFDVEQHPEATFRSTALEHVDGSEFRLRGELTIKGITREVILDGEYLGTVTNTDGQEVIGFTAEAEVNRKDWDLTWNMALETGGVLVGDTVKLVIDAEAVAT
jgi:polyisoprenoid-binding protein YceI